MNQKALCMYEHTLIVIAIFLFFQMEKDQIARKKLCVLV